MTPLECMRILELPPSATPQELKNAYRRLARRYHPDRRRGERDASEEFVRVSEAYRTLTRAARSVKAGRQVGTCARCRGFGEVFRSQDGLVVCPKCALESRRRYLPLPVIIVVRCIIPALLLLFSAFLLLRAFERGELVTAAWAFATSLGSIGALGVICLRVRHCERPPRTHRREDAAC